MLSISDLIVRPFKHKDMEAVTTLLLELGYKGNANEVEHRMHKISSLPDYKTIVAEYRDKTIALAGMVKIHFWERSDWYFKLQVFVVSEQFRRCGVGKHVLEYCEKIASEEGAYQLLLSSANAEHRASAHAFYPAMGYTVESTTYIKALK